MHVLDRIERKVLLNASRKQVWDALTDAEQFGSWFGIALKGKTFVAGQTIEAPITYPGYEHVVWKARIERILPQTLFSFRWHPFAVEEGVDYDQETPTLVEFTLEDRAPGILLRVVESGFDAIPRIPPPESLQDELPWLGRTNGQHRNLHHCSVVSGLARAGWRSHPKRYAAVFQVNRGVRIWGGFAPPGAGQARSLHK